MAIVKLYLAGLVVLLGAILVNLAADALGLATWYPFLNAVGQEGLADAVRAARPLDLAFLAAGYPACLGGLAWAGLKLAARVVRRRSA